MHSTFKIITVLVIALFVGAWTHGAPGAIGKAQLNLGAGELIPANFINILKVASSAFSGGADPSILDANGYPKTSFTGTYSLSFSAGAWTGVQYKLSWPATRTFTMTFLTASSDCSSVNATVTGCSGGNVTVSSQAGLAGSLTFTPTSFVIQFPGTGTYGGSGDIVFGRLSDAAAAVAGEIYTPEFLAVQQGLRPEAIRPMGWVNTTGNNQSSEVKWAYRATLSSLSWAARQYPPGAWGGTVSGTDAYTIGAAPDTPLSGWVANEVIQGSVTNAATKITISGAASNGGNIQLTVNATTSLSPSQSVWINGVGGTVEANGIQSILTVDDSTHITINVSFVNAYTSGGLVATQTLTVTGKTGGAKFIANATGLPIYSLSESSASTQGPSSYFYDGILDRVIYTSGGISASVPIEAQAKLANKLNANLWAVIPVFAEDDYVLNWSPAAAANLNNNLFFGPEYTNELWNFSFPQTQWGTQRGLALGFPLGNNEATYGWYSLRVRQIMGNLVPPAWSGKPSQLQRVLAYQGVGAVASLTSTFRLKSADLAPSGISTGKGNALYSSYTGGADYTSKPNRAVDVVETLGYAPYAAGTNFSDQGLNGGTVASALNATFLQNLATLADANPNDPTALALFDNDQRQGTVRTQIFSCPGGTTITLTSHGFIANTNTESALVFTVSGGTLCSGLLTTQAYCIITITTNTFQVANYNSDGTCGTTPISIGSGTGTPSVGQANRGTLIQFASGLYPIWETMAASFDSDRPAGMAPLRVEWYEGAIEPITPSAATLTSIGVLIPAGTGTGAAANTALQNLLIAWKNNALSSAFIQSYYNQFMGLDPAVPTFGLFPHSKAPAHLVLLGGGPYGLVSGTLPNSAPYQLYNGFAAFSTP